MSVRRPVYIWIDGRREEKEKKKQREKNGDCICTLARLVR